MLLQWGPFSAYKKIYISSGPNNIYLSGPHEELMVHRNWIWRLGPPLPPSSWALHECINWVLWFQMILHCASVRSTCTDVPPRGGSLTLSSIWLGRCYSWCWGALKLKLTPRSLPHVGLCLLETVLLTRAKAGAAHSLTSRISNNT